MAGVLRCSSLITVTDIGLILILTIAPIQWFTTPRHFFSTIEFLVFFYILLIYIFYIFYVQIPRLMLMLITGTVKVARLVIAVVNQDAVAQLFLYAAFYWNWIYIPGSGRTQLFDCLVFLIII